MMKCGSLLLVSGSCLRRFSTDAISASLPSLLDFPFASKGVTRRRCVGFADNAELVGVFWLLFASLFFLF
eukprot:1528203-Rhodomonas_salina.1